MAKKFRTKLIYTASALPLILEALGYKNSNNYLLHLSDGSYVYQKGNKIKVSEIVGFRKGEIFLRKKKINKLK